MAKKAMKICMRLATVELACSSGVNVTPPSCQIEIKNNGSKVKLPVREGKGLKLVNNRLKLHYNDSYDFTVSQLSQQNTGGVAEITFSIGVSPPKGIRCPRNYNPYGYFLRKSALN